MKMWKNFCSFILTFFLSFYSSVLQSQKFAEQWHLASLARSRWFGLFFTFQFGCVPYFSGRLFVVLLLWLYFLCWINYLRYTFYLVLSIVSPLLYLINCFLSVQFSIFQVIISGFFVAIGVISFDCKIFQLKSVISVLTSWIGFSNGFTLFLFLIVLS